jgi:hypothetical protein
MNNNGVIQELNNANKYTSFTDIQPLKFYNIIGVLINYCSSFQSCKLIIILLNFVNNNYRSKIYFYTNGLKT